MARLLASGCFLCFLVFCIFLLANKARNNQYKANCVPRSALTTSCSKSDKEISSNCHHALKLGNSHSGVYKIDPRDDHCPFKVYCDMKTDGGEWT